MKIASAQRSLLVLLFSALLGSFAVNASSVVKRRAHALRSRHLAASGVTKEAAANDEDQQGGDDDDDDDDDDSEDATQPADGKMTLQAAEQKRDIVAKKVAMHVDYRIPVNSHAAEETKLKQSVAKVEQELAANIAEQKMLKNQISRLSDESESNREIDVTAKLVANETDSVAMAGMLGGMWKEMRMFELPFFEQHVKEEIHHLKKDEQTLEDELEAAQGRLSEARKSWAAGKKAKGEAKAKSEGKSENEDDEAEEKPAVAEKKEKDNTAKATDAVLEVKTVKSGEASLGNGLEAAVVQKWSFWNMDAKQRKEVLFSSLAYLLFGVLFAYLYQTARKRNPSVFEPKSRAPAGQDPSQKDFSFSLFGCLNDPNVCVVGCCCPCLRWAHTMDKKGLVRYWRAFFMMFVLMLLHVYTWGISTLLACIMGVYYRQKLRAAYGFEKGSRGKTMLMDILAWFCCQPCAIVQEAREEAAHTRD